MKTSVVILFCLGAVTVSVPTSKESDDHADRTFLERQRHILQLFQRVNQVDHRYPEYEQIGKNFSISKHADSYSKPEVVQKFLRYLKHGLLRRDEIFSIMNKEHLEEAVALFKVLYYAKDWDTFFKTVLWARQNVNQGIFVYTFYLSLIHRPDTRNFMLPPIYEVFPHYFFSSEVIQQAEDAKQEFSRNSQDKTFVTVESNYSGWYLNLHPEQALSYYLEDVGVNSCYYYYTLYDPIWMSGEEFGWTQTKRGELYLFMMQQFLVRYYFERVANGFGEIPFVDWDTPVETPYEPSLVYPNGLHFPSRPKFANLHEYFYNYKQRWSSNVYGYSHNLLKDYEGRINEAIDKGFVITKEGKLVPIYRREGLNILGNIIEHNADSLNSRYYGNYIGYASHLLGYSMQPLDKHRLIPSALEHMETAHRDPVFLQLFKRVTLKYQKYMQNFEPYTEQDLIFPGVKIARVEMDPLVTFFDYFYSDLSNAVRYTPEENDDFHIRVRQLRLNHKPFNVKILINSNKEQNVYIKTYLGLKYDEYGREVDLKDNVFNMVEVDEFSAKLKSGDNEIVRSCYDFEWYVKDRSSQIELYESVVNALDHDHPFKLDGRQNYYYFPTRFVIPKGSPAGTTYKFVFVISEWAGGEIPEEDPFQIIPPGIDTLVPGNRSLFYPFDRPIEFEELWYQIPNIHFHEEKIYHEEIQETKSYERKD